VAARTGHRTWWRIAFAAVLMLTALLALHALVTSSPSPGQPTADSGSDRPGRPDRNPAIYFWRGALMRPLKPIPPGAPGGPEPGGMEVGRVIPGSGAARAGITPGDIIVSLDAAPVASPRALAIAITDRPGGPITLKVWCRDSRRVAVVLLRTVS